MNTQILVRFFLANCSITVVFSSFSETVSQKWLVKVYFAAGWLDAPHQPPKASSSLIPPRFGRRFFSSIFPHRQKGQQKGKHISQRLGTFELPGKFTLLWWNVVNMVKSSWYISWLKNSPNFQPIFTGNSPSSPLPRLPAYSCYSTSREMVQNDPKWSITTIYPQRSSTTTGTRGEHRIPVQAEAAAPAVEIPPNTSFTAPAKDAALAAPMTSAPATANTEASTTTPTSMDVENQDAGSVLPPAAHAPAAAPAEQTTPPAQKNSSTYKPSTWSCHPSHSFITTPGCFGRCT